MCLRYPHKKQFLKTFLHPQNYVLVLKYFSPQKSLLTQISQNLLRPPRGSVKLVSTKLTNLVPLEQFHHKPMGMYDSGRRPPSYILWQWSETTVIHSQRFVMELLHWHKVCELGGDKLNIPPVVALRRLLNSRNLMCMVSNFIWVAEDPKVTCPPGTFCLIIQIFEWRSGYKIIKQNVSGGLFFSDN